MKSKKWLAVAGITLSATLLLAACGKADKKTNAPTTFSYVYAIDPTTLDYSITSKSSTSDCQENRLSHLLVLYKGSSHGRSLRPTQTG